MIKIECDMKKIRSIHSIYVEEFLFPKYFSLYKTQSEQIKDYLNNLLGNKDEVILEHLKGLCVDTDLEQIICKEKYIRGKIFGKTMKDKQSYKDLKKIWDMILDYEGFNRGRSKGAKYSVSWNRHLFVEMTNIKVCPYCNRNYITSYVEDDKDNRIHTTASIDHYYPKAIYPILQLNVFNMIPSCTVCNSYTKGIKDLKHLNPYFDKGSISFKMKLNSVESLYSSNCNICIVAGNDKKSRVSVEVFKLNKIYETHNSILNEIKEKVMDYENFKENYYEKLLGEIDIGIDNIYKNWFDFLFKEEKDEPLVKLKKDIYNQIIG